MNANFSALNSISTLTIPFITFSSDNEQIQSDGNGNLLWSGGLGFAGYNDLFDGTGTTTLIKTRSAVTAGVFHFQIPNGTDVLTVTNSGWTFIPGSKRGIHFTTGSITYTSPFGGAGSGFYSHNLGVVPNIVLPVTTNQNVQRIGYVASTMTTTQVNIRCDGGALGFWGWAIGF